MTDTLHDSGSDVAGNGFRIRAQDGSSYVASIALGAERERGRDRRERDYRVYALAFCKQTVDGINCQSVALCQHDAFDAPVDVETLVVDPTLLTI